ncbi:MAG: AMP-binding protein [Candidatus Sumerlaeia bacterium]|nr:AMP-binding protein [Candidatus Sumerlaeia bacterium]
MSDFLWHPDDHPWTRESHVARFMRAHGCATIDELRARASADTAWFWQAALDDLALDWFQPYHTLRDDSAGFPFTKWFVGGRINIAQNCIDRHVLAGHGGDVALYAEGPDDLPEERRAVTFAELKRLVDACAGALAANGVARGDAVGLYAPMRVETAVAFFAAMKLGARIVPIFCGFGEQAIVDRLDSCGAKLLFTAETLARRGKAVPCGGTARAAAARVPTIARVVATDTAEWDAFLAEGAPMERAAETDAEEPCLLIYTSGTTGRPKGTVHTHAGCLAQMGKELRYAFDARPGEPFFWVTDIGWMMGPWELVGCLLHRTPVVLLDGTPNHPSPDRLWEICERLRVGTLGIAPTAVRLLMREQGARGPRGFDLSALRVLGSTGEPWDETSYRWFASEAGGGRCPVVNISGGTEIVGCLLQPYPVEPLKACSLGGPALGMDVDIVNESGASVRGEVGYLVCRQPAPSMTKGFLGDEARYLETYFSKFPGVWNHGDWAEVDADGQWYVRGRADDTIKVAGKRVGPAEVEGVLMSHPAVAEAAVVGVPDDLKGQALVCFVVLKPGASAPEAELAAHVAAQQGKPLAPKRVHAVAALPKTRSGKIVRGSIRRAYIGEGAGDATSVENPAALDAIAALGAG